MAAAVPESVLDSLKQTQANVDEVSGYLNQFLAVLKDDPDALNKLPPLQRASAYLAVSKAATALFSVKLRCSGIDPDEHPIKKELERLGLHEEKLEKCVESSKAPLRPSTTINRQAATRFIEHSLPDLTPEQRQNMREISKGQDTRGKLSKNSRFQRKRKHQASEKQSSRIAAQEFLEKAARELLGSNDSGLKGPLQNEASDEEDEPMVD